MKIKKNGQVVTLTESDLTRIVQRVVKEENDFVTGIAASEKAEIVQEVIDRIREYGFEYIQSLRDFNTSYEIRISKNQERINRRDFVVPKGVKISKSTFPDEL
jgi:hypothetical protein